MKEYVQKSFKGERALFDSEDIKAVACTFSDGESHFKHCRNIELDSCLLYWKYPLWYCSGVKVKNSAFFENTRAGIWYTKNIEISDTTITSPKNFRRCDGVALKNVSLPDAKETFWHCSNVTLEDVDAAGDYFCMDTENIKASGLKLTGKYSFDGAKNVEITNSRLMTKDAFWNSANVTVRDSFISSEYLGWNSENLTFINCTIESLQGLCYIGNLVMRNCRLINTTLAFEYSEVDVEAEGRIDSVLNPSSGRIRCDEIGELIVEDGRVVKANTSVEAANVAVRKDRPDWIEG